MTAPAASGAIWLLKSRFDASQFAPRFAHAFNFDAKLVFLLAQSRNIRLDVSSADNAKLVFGQFDNRILQNAFQVWSAGPEAPAMELRP